MTSFIDFRCFPNMPFFKHEKNVIPRSRRLENTTHKNGLRHLILNTAGDSFIGEWKNNEKNGKGVFLTRNNELYEGDFVNNLRHGFGVMAYQLPKLNVFALLYRGDWKNGKMHGDGLRIYKDGSFYLGAWKEGKRDGHGQMWYADGSFYDGDWKKDLREGPGLLVRADGNRFEGSWLSDVKHGKGRFYFLSAGLLQEGVWINDSCTFSKVCNLPFRQSSKKPAIYPIPPAWLIDIDQICKLQEQRTLEGTAVECLDSADNSYESLMILKKHSR